MITIGLDATLVKQIARECGFEIAGIAPAEPVADAGYYLDWVRRGLAGEMRYLTDHRAGLRRDPRSLLASARSILSVGKLYNSPRPYSTAFSDAERGWISRYAWGDDYHDVLRRGLEQIVARLRERVAFEYKICVDTAPLLERSLAERAGLGWIGKNTCLINQQMGSWFFLGELLLSLDVEPDAPPPARCGTCTRCIDACPTDAIGPAYELDARLCISYFTIELRSPIPEGLRAPGGFHVFGCDICQDVCPWNRRAAESDDPGFAPREEAPRLEKLAALTEEDFRAMFRDSPVRRAKYAGFLRNVAVAMGNSGSPRFREPLEKLTRCGNPMVEEHARWALERI